MGRFRFLWHEHRCIGCMACQMACKEVHGLGIGETFRTVHTKTEGSLLRFVSEGCLHCAQPACALACPTGAAKRCEDGTVLIDYTLCIGCGACVTACPQSHPFLKAGIAHKCSGCADRRNLGFAPVCVSACPTGALNFTEKEEVL